MHTVNKIHNVRSAGGEIPEITDAHVINLGMSMSERSATKYERSKDVF
jgi:hypothetical protein